MDSVNFLQVPSNKFLIVDKQVSGNRAQLRSIPLLKKIGANCFTYNYNWRPPGKPPVELISHDYVKFPERCFDSNKVVYPFSQIVSQEIENYRSYSLTRKIIFDSDKKNGVFVLVTDTNDFRLKNTFNDRPLIEDNDFVSYKYEEILKKILRDNFDLKNPPLPFGETKNLFFQEMAYSYQKKGYKVSSVKDLFDYPYIPSQSQAWDFLYKLSEKRNEIFETTSFVNKCFRSFLERGNIEKISEKITNFLDYVEYNKNNIKKMKDENKIKE